MESLLYAKLCSRCSANHSRQGRRVAGLRSLIIVSISGGNGARKKVQHAKGKSESAVLYTVVREDCSEEAASKQHPDEVKEGAVWMSRERAFQVVGAASGAKAWGWTVCLGTPKGAMWLAQRAWGFLGFSIRSVAVSRRPELG